jgi:poly(3-hydroxybutyrate) depolymerase
VKGVDGKVERVRPQDIKGTALMTVEGELDDISGSGQTRAAQDLCSGVPASERLHLEVPGAGHYGIFSGRRWRDVVYPQVVKFILSHPLENTAKTVAVAAPKAPAPAPVKPVVAKAAKTEAALAPAKVAAKATPAAQKTAAKAVAKPVKAPAKSASPVKSGAAVKTTWVKPKTKA